MLVIHSDLLFFFCTQVLIIDPSNENVILVAEELHIRLASSSASHLDWKDNLSGQHDVKGAEEDCKFSCASFKLQMSEAWSFVFQVSLYL